MYIQSLEWLLYLPGFLQLKLPEDGATLPPSPAVAVKMYFGVILLGVVPGSCESSLAQVNRSSRLR